MTPHKILNAGTTVALFSGILLLVFVFLYRTGSPYYHTYAKSRLAGEVLNPEKQVSTLVFGSSHGRSVNLDAMGMNGANLSVSGQDLFEIDYKIRSIAHRLPHLKTVFVSISYFSFVFDNGTTAEGERSRDGKRINLYAEYPLTLPYIRGDAQNFLKGVLHPLITQDHWERILTDSGVEPEMWHENKKRHKKQSLESLREAAAQIEKDRKTLRRLNAHATARVNNYQPVIHAMIAHHPGLSEDIVETTESFIRRLQQQGVRVVLFTPPYFTAYNRLFNKTWKDQMRTSLAALQRRVSVEYYDFSSDAEFTEDTRLFKNSDHLNPLGKQLFSLRLKQAVDMRAER